MTDNKGEKKKSKTPQTIANKTCDSWGTATDTKIRSPGNFLWKILKQKMKKKKRRKAEEQYYRLQELRSALFIKSYLETRHKK